MKLIDHLDYTQRDKLNKKYRKKEKINWIGLMGVNRDTYKRGKGGAIRSNRR